MPAISEILRENPELALFLALASGFLIGNIKIGSFKLGVVLGTLFSGLIIGLLGISISPTVKIIFFDLFLFATGYKVGPQFFRGLKKDALPQLALTLIICISSLFTVYFIAKLMNYNIGTAAGLLAGAFTESTIIGTAAEAIGRLSIPESEKEMLINSIPVAYTATYLIGTTSVIWFLSTIAPRILKVDSKGTNDLSGGDKNSSNSESDSETTGHDWSLRAFQVSSTKIIGLTIRELEYLFPEGRIITERIRRDGRLFYTDENTVICEGDILAVRARKHIMVQLIEQGKEVNDNELLDIPFQSVKIVITQKSYKGQTLGEIGGKYGSGIAMSKLIRTGIEIPFNAGTIVFPGDLLIVSGRKHILEMIAKKLGYMEENTPDTDIRFVAFCIFIGGIIGLLSIKIFGVPITLTTSGGALVMGLVAGWARSRRPVFGKVPEAALWIFDTLGLTTFIAIVGISAGPVFVDGLKSTGFGIMFAGFVAALLPHVIGLLAGRYLLRMNPQVLLGAQAGAGTNTTALKSVQEKLRSKIPALGYTVPYALGNILLTAWGPVIVALMS